VPKTPKIEIFRRLPELSWIIDKDLRHSVLELLAKYPSYLDQPSSVTAKHHKGENRCQHVRMALRIIQWICEEFNITGIRRDRLIAAMILHDIGYVKSLRKGEVKGWTYYPQTGWSSKSREDNVNHPVHGFNIIINSDIPNGHKIEIANMILKHMSHWYGGTPLPETDDEKFIAIADYLSSRKGLVLVGLEVEDWRK